MVTDAGHIYEVKEINHEAKNRVTITLFDATKKSFITKYGTLKNNGSIFIDKIEGHKNVEITVNFSSTRAKIVKNEKTGDKYQLASSMYW